MTSPIFIISPATPADCPAIQQLVNRAYAATDSTRAWTSEHGVVTGQRITLAEVEQLLATPGTHILVARQAENVVGTVTLIDGADYCKLNMLEVDPACQQYGLGKQLIEYGEALVRRHFHSRRLRIDVVSSRHALLAFYQRRGFINLNTPYPYPLHLVATTPLDSGLMVEVLEKVV